MDTISFTGKIIMEQHIDVSEIVLTFAKNSESIGTNCNDVVIATIICGAIVLIGILGFVLILRKINLQKKKSGTVGSTHASEQKAIEKAKREREYDLQDKLLTYIKEKGNNTKGDFYVETITGFINELGGKNPADDTAENASS